MSRGASLHGLGAGWRRVVSRGGTLAVGALAVPLLPWLRRRPAFRSLARRLFAAAPPAAADLIHVLGGGHAGPQVRIDHAVSLYRRGLAPRLLLTGSEWRIDWAERNRARARSLGVPDEALWLDPAPRSTREEALALRERAQRDGLRSAILVTEAFHSGRAERLFAHALRGTGTRILSCPCQAGGFPPARWWDEPRLRALILGEAARLCLARALGAA